MRALLLTWWLICLGATVADAGSAKRKAFNDAVEEARGHWNAGRYTRARSAYKRAYRIHDDPNLLFNIAATHQRQAHLRRALAKYREFLTHRGMDPVHRERAERAIRILDGALVARNQELEERYSQWSSLEWTGASVGVAGLALTAFGIVQGVRSRAVHRELEGLEVGDTWRPDRYRHGQSLERQSVALSVLGIGAVIGGASLFAVGRRGRNLAREKYLGVTPTLAYPGLAVVGRF